MPDKYYDHYLNLTKENLISLIKEKDIEITKIKKILKETQLLKDKYFEYNKFHMEEIVRLDKIIGSYRKPKLTL